MKESEILDKLDEKFGISQLNEMQLSTLAAWQENQGDVILHSPTGSGKTIAFLIPLFKAIKNKKELQIVIIAPSRELVMQIAEVARTITSKEMKVSACYGGHNMLDEKQSLSIIPEILVATPGRLLDHVNRKNIDLFRTRYLVLDEFDKSLELGFSEEMGKLLKCMPNISRRILTSATKLSEYPSYLRLNNQRTLDFPDGNHELRQRINVHRVNSPEKDKLHTLLSLLNNIPENSRCIVFVNHREAVDRIWHYLKENELPVGIYHGGLDQIDREKAIAMFNNGSFMVLISTDLGARGLDIETVAHIIHYHMPADNAVYTHRNGRTARINASGDVHIIVAPEENVPEYIEFDDTALLDVKAQRKIKSEWSTLYFKAGKKEKISKGDVVGFLLNNCNLQSSEIGTINSYDHYTLVAVPCKKAKAILKAISPKKIKNQKVKIDLARQ